jgi:hypothetical protein
LFDGKRIPHHQPRGNKVNSTKEILPAAARGLQRERNLNITRLAAVWLLSLAGLVANAGYASSTSLGDFVGKWKAQGGKDSLVISPQKIISTSWHKNDAGKPEKYTGEARWSNLDSDSNEEETFGLSKKQTTLSEISKRYEMRLKRYKKDPSDYGMDDPKISRKAIQAMSPGTYQVMWSYFGGESGEEYIVDKDHMLEIKDDPYGFSVTLYDRVK